MTETDSLENHSESSTGLTVEFTHRLRDYEDYFRHAQFVVFRKKFIVYLVGFPLGMILLVTATWMLADLPLNAFAGRVLVSQAWFWLFLIVIFVVWPWRMFSAPQRQARPIYEMAARRGQHRVTLSRDGVLVQRRGQSESWTWDSIEDIRVARSLLLLVSDTTPKAMQALIIPQRAFSDAEAFTRFKETAEKLWRAASPAESSSAK